MAAQPKKAERKVKARAYALEAGKPYTQLVAHRSHFAAYTLAALTVAGMIRLNKASASKSGKAGDLKLLRSLVGKTAYKTWTPERVNKDGRVTVAGLNEVNTRLSGGNRYATEMDLVKTFVQGMRKGGEVKLGDTHYKLMAPIK